METPVVYLGAGLEDGARAARRRYSLWLLAGGLTGVTIAVALVMAWRSGASSGWAGWLGSRNEGRVAGFICMFGCAVCVYAVYEVRYRKALRRLRLPAEGAGDIERLLWNNLPLVESGQEWARVLGDVVVWGAGARGMIVYAGADGPRQELRAAESGEVMGAATSRSGGLKTVAILVLAGAAVGLPLFMLLPAPPRGLLALMIVLMGAGLVALPMALLLPGDPWPRSAELGPEGLTVHHMFGKDMTYTPWNSILAVVEKEAREKTSDTLSMATYQITEAQKGRRARVVSVWCIGQPDAEGRASSYQLLADRPLDNPAWKAACEMWLRAVEETDSTSNNGAAGA